MLPAPLPENRENPARNRLSLIRGGGEHKAETIGSRNAAVRVLVEVGADLLLKRITAERAEEIQKRIDRVLQLFDRVDAMPSCLPELRRELDELEILMRETRELKKRIKRKSV